MEMSYGICSKFHHPPGNALFWLLHINRSGRLQIGAMATATTGTQVAMLTIEPPAHTRAGAAAQKRGEDEWSRV
jgi:hypothetical protein